MSVNGISFFSPICTCGTSDYEQIQIERLLKMYGIEPSGNKAADKAKLHEIELQKAKAQNEPSGKFFTVSYGKEQEIIKTKKESLYGSLKNYKKEKGNDDTILKADEIMGKQILAIIEMKKREEKDIAKSKELKTDKLDKLVQKNKRKKKENTPYILFQTPNLTEINTPPKEPQVITKFEE